MKIVSDDAAVSFGGHKPVSRRTLRKWRARRRVADGFPWAGKFTTREEVGQYFGGDTIVCLLCGRALRRLGIHLPRIHGISEDEYRERYGLPWRRGLTSAESHASYSAAVNKRMDEGFREFLGGLRALPGARDKIEEGARNQRPPPDFIRRELAGRCADMLGIEFEKEYTAEDADEFLRRIATGRTCSEVWADADMPKKTWWTAYCRQHPDYRARFKAIWDSLPFDVQARGQRMGKRFVTELRKLFDAGVSDHTAARILGVTAMTCNYRTKVWRAGLTSSGK